MPITIKGLDQLYKKLGNVIAIKTLEPPMQRSLNRLQAAMQVYPPSPSGSKYIRGYGMPGRPTSEKYGQRWTTKLSRSGNGLSGRVGNNASYAPFVGSHLFQAKIHRGRWETDANAIKENEGAIVADFQSAVDRALAS